MNKHFYRIVFNASRGLRMVVQESARSTGKGAARSTRGAAVGATIGLFGALVAAGANAQIIADPNAPANQRAPVLVAPNGVPLVNIQTPTAGGVSRNTYRQFDVDGKGAILNNSRANVQTQLGGWVQGNPFLGRGPARITGATDYTSSSAEHYQKNLNAGSETWYRDAGTGINAKRTDTHEEQRTDVVRSELSGANVSILAKGTDGKDGTPGALGDLTLSGTTITTPGTLTLEADNLHLASQQSEKSVSDNRLAIDHVLAGEINAKDRATGYHAEFAANGTARITPGATATQNANGTYEAPVQVYDAKKGGWVNKDRGSTFFPLDWSEARLNYEVTEAFKNSAKSSQWAGQRGSSPSGVVIQFFWDQKNQRTTFYPLGK